MRILLLISLSFRVHRVSSNPPERIHMVMPFSSARSFWSANKIEHQVPDPSCAPVSAGAELSPLPCHPQTNPLPAGALLSSFMKTLETEFISRKLIVPPNAEFFPIWFLVETERNVFLWRSGLSLCDADDFEFWVDPARLIEKRLLQLENSEIGNPFVNPTMDIFSTGSAMAGQEAASLECSSNDEERDYLTSFLEVLRRVAPHAHALSEVASVVSRAPSMKRLPRVLLPLGRTTQKAGDGPR